MKRSSIIPLTVALALIRPAIAISAGNEIFSCTFKSELAKEWKMIGGKWEVKEGYLEQTDPGPADPKKAIIVLGDEEAVSGAVVITAKLRLNWIASDQVSRAGIGVCTSPENGYGLNLVFFQGRLQFLQDFVAWGEGCVFPYESGKWYWIKLDKTNGELRGKAWLDGEKEPGEWMVTWSDYSEDLTGYPALNGGSYKDNSVSFAQVVVETKASAQPASNGRLNPAAVKLEILPGQPWRLPLGLNPAGPPSRLPRAIITLAARKPPQGDVLLVGYRGGKEVSRQRLSWPEKRPFAVRMALGARPEEVVLMARATLDAPYEEIKRQAVPRLPGAAEPEPLASAAPDPRARVVKTTEVLLSGSDWKLGSFPMGKGELAKAHLPAFDDRGFRTVRVPGEVQLQVGLQGMDLYYQSRELSLINEQEWWYRKTFVPAKEHAGKMVRLRFEGVDYFATVWLNGEKLGEHEGCFVPFASFDLSSKLRLGAENLLVVKVTCPWVPPDRGFFEYMKGEWTMGFGGMRLPYPTLSLGPYWDGIPAYGNAIFPMGLFRDVKLVVSGTLYLNDLFVQTQALPPDGSATLALSGTIVNGSDQPLTTQLEWVIAPENFDGAEIRLPGQALTVQPGENPFTIPVVVTNPQLWWTWDTGAQNLYKLTASISAAEGLPTDSRHVVFGIRTIERRPDMSYWLNGQRLFLKGGWYPMSDYFVSRTQRADYEKDLELYKAANLNHLVAFTLVENPDFYDLCDRLGILEFFEFPFQQWGPVDVLNGTNPRREIFVEESLSQLRQIILQLRNHPSIVVWTPFAEIGDAYRKYGEYTRQIAQLVAELAPGTVFHPSLCDVGEQHFWMGNAGMGMEDSYLEHFEANTGFVSEYGSLAIPAYETFKTMLTPDEIWSSKNTLLPAALNVPINVPAYAYHTCFEYGGLNSMLHRIRRFVDQRPRSIQEFIDDSQLYQGFIFKYATECYRRKKYNSINGTRIWCYRDLAPRIHWGFVDFYHVPKLGYYYLKTAHERFALSFAYKEALESQPPAKPLKIPVWVINDHRRAMPVDVRCELFDLKGHPLWSRDFAGTVESDGSKEIGAVDCVTPPNSGIYVLRGTARERGGKNLSARNSAFIKVVNPQQVEAPLSVAAPSKELLRPVKILLIGQKRFSDPIARWLNGAGAQVKVIKEETIDQFAALRDPGALRTQYDVVWLACFDSLWKFMDDEMAHGLARAIERGVGFIHSGGEGSFHGGAGRGALIDARPLAEVLPVTLKNRNDVIYDWFAKVNEIKRLAPPAGNWSEAGLGVSGFNDVELKPESELIMTISGRPLLVTGRYGQGKTVVFTGFTPAETTLPQAFTALFTRMLVEVSGESIRNEYQRLAAQNEPAFEAALPLFQNLKALPLTALRLPERIAVKTAGKRAKTTLSLTNGERYARLVRLRSEWETGKDQAPFILFSDNFIDLLPNENRSIDLDFLLPGKRPAKVQGTLIVEGPNVVTRRLPVVVQED